MWLWSKGLGRLVLPMDLGRWTIEVQPDKLILRGKIVAPRVNWDCTATLYEDDLKGFVGILNDPQVIRYLAKTEGAHLLGGLLTRGFRFVLLYLSAKSRKWITRRQA